MAHEFLAGVLQIANVFLSVVAGVLAITLFKAAFKKKEMKAWKPLIVVLILFAIVEVFGALNAFGIYVTAHMTHLLASLVLAFLLYSLILQYDVVK